MKNEDARKYLILGHKNKKEKELWPAVAYKSPGHAKHLFWNSVILDISGESPLVLFQIVT